MLTAVLDTCVLYSGLRRDFLLSLVAEGVYRLVLTEDILFEIEYVEVRKLTGLGTEHSVAEMRAAQLAGQLRKNFDIESGSRTSLVAPVGLPDPDDEHLVAAAIAGGAEVIVTENLRDLPAHILPAGIRAMSPQDFLHDIPPPKPTAIRNGYPGAARPERKPSHIYCTCASEAASRTRHSFVDSYFVIFTAHQGWTERDSLERPASRWVTSLRRKGANVPSE